jgi:hypothetical protein
VGDVGILFRNIVEFSKSRTAPSTDISFQFQLTSSPNMIGPQSVGLLSWWGGSELDRALGDTSSNRSKVLEYFLIIAIPMYDRLLTMILKFSLPSAFV